MFSWMAMDCQPSQWVGGGGGPTFAVMDDFIFVGWWFEGYKFQTIGKYIDFYFQELWIRKKNCWFFKSCQHKGLYQIWERLSLERGCRFESQQENFLLQSQLCVLTLIRCLFQPLLMQWHIKDPSHSDRSAGGRLHLNTYTPLTQQSRNGPTVLQSRHNVGTYPETTSHTTCQGTFSHSRLRSWSHCGLILALRVELMHAS